MFVGHSQAHWRCNGADVAVAVAVTEDVAPVLTTPAAATTTPTAMFTSTATAMSTTDAPTVALEQRGILESCLRAWLG